MEFLCPSCQKMLTVPEQFAGQPMKCPLCGNAFQAPSLAPAPSSSTAEPKAETYTYSVAPEPEPATVSSAPATPRGAANKSGEPAAEKSATPPPRPSSTPTPPGEYGRKFTLQLKPQVLPYIPPGALLLIFFLTFFSWVGSFPGRVVFAKQNAWQAAFNSYSSDLDYETKDKAGNSSNVITSVLAKPGVSALTVFWLLAFLPLLALAIAVALLPRLQVKLPPAVQRYWPSRMLIIAAVALIPLFLMVVQDIVGFPLEDTIIQKAKSKVGDFADEDKKLHEFQEGVAISGYALQHTNVYRLVFFLLLLTIFTALLEYWIEKRGPNKPLPRIDLLW